MTRIAALVPMKHHSQRVPEKNYRSLAGKPLYFHILDTLQQVPELSGIWVNTDSPVLSEGIKEHFPEIKIIQRPNHLCGDQVSMNKILLYDVEQIEADYYFQTHTTNPLLKPGTIQRGLKEFLTQRDQYDSLFAVTRLQTRLWDHNGVPINHDPDLLIQTQDLPPVYEENSCMYVFSKSSILDQGNRIGNRPLMFEIDPEEAWDIDTLLDFRVVDFLFRQEGK